MTAVRAVEQQTRGVFNVIDDGPAPAGKWLPHLASYVAAKTRCACFPKWPARLPAGEAAVTMTTAGRGFSNAKAKRELGWVLCYPS
ncbi:hypothetical protein [Streptomyces sp. CB01881]|uniref:hypothetical protein n=1 Tax=Streptomyces sp. CB01881 TaxID=2078691 RepID=UPI000CDBFBC3|nr:hypothetical protein [Streptomyces sp. CB01881]AUY53440.1 hypothetical protein C2142_36260 [Streptomyces sp. CB01881]TYC69592.1 hypothetical protein EH183_36310 [Streptomyces sp. CB01881]